MKYLMPAALLSALALTGCGGESDNTTGGGSTSPAAQGLWTGYIVSPTKSASMLVLSGGSLWMVYTKDGSNVVGGAMYAKAASPNGSTYTATAPLEFNLEALGPAIRINLLSTSLVAGSKFWGNYNYVSSPSSVFPFQTTYNSNNTTSLPAIVRTVSGTTGSKAGLSITSTEAMNALTINTTTGVITGVTATSACTVSGSITPISGVKAYLVDVTFSGGSGACANASGSAGEAAGVAFYDDNGKLNILALNETRTNGFVFREN